MAIREELRPVPDTSQQPMESEGAESISNPLGTEEHD